MGTVSFQKPRFSFTTPLSCAGAVSELVRSAHCEHRIGGFSRKRGGKSAAGDHASPLVVCTAARIAVRTTDFRAIYVSTLAQTLSRTAPRYSAGLLYKPQVQPAFENTLANNYHAPLATLDFIANPEAARSQIHTIEKALVCA